MSDNLWLIVLRETLLSVDVLLVLVVPLLLFLATVVYFRSNPLGASEAWKRVGRRFMTLGGILVFLTLALYLTSGVVFNMQKGKHDKKYIATLNKAFRVHFNQKDFPIRMSAFAQRITKPKVLSDELGVFVKKVSPEERALVLKCCGNVKRNLVESAISFSMKMLENVFKIDENMKEEEKEQILENELGWNDLVLNEFMLMDWGKIEEGKKFFRDYAMAPDAWNKLVVYVRRENRQSDMQFLRKIAEVFGKENKGKPTQSVEKLYGSIADKACPTELQKMSVYLQDKPEIAKFVQFCLGYRFWVRSGVPAVILLIVGLVMTFKGRGIAVEGMRRKLFK